MEEVVLEISPLYDVPAALSGEAEETGTIRWGDWYWPLMSAGQEVDDGEGWYAVRLGTSDSMILDVIVTVDGAGQVFCSCLVTVETSSFVIVAVIVWAGFVIS